MKKNDKTAFYLRWNYWLILALIIIIGVFSWSEKEIEQKQPSAEWSMGVRLLEGLPADERKISLMETAEGSGFAIGYINRSGIHLAIFDEKGEILNTATYEHEAVESLRLIKLESIDGIIRVYLSDRVQLEAWDIDPGSLDTLDNKILSTHSEQFTSEDNIVFVGDDEKIEIYKDDILIAEITEYEDLKLGVVTADDTGIYGGFNAADGGRVFRFDDNGLEVFDVVKVSEQSVYGYFKDVYVNNGLVTFMSSNFNRTNPGAASPLGVWQFNQSSMESLYFQPYYHVGTDLNPIIEGAELNKVTYILGTLQTTRSVDPILMKYPQASGGKFVNVSKYTRDNDVLIENTRLTVTRNYPVGYSYLTIKENPVFLWMDKENLTTTLMAAGPGEDWINLARSKYETNYVSLIAGSAIALINTFFLGVITLLSMLKSYYYWIIGYIVVLLLYKRFAPIEQSKKEAQTFWIPVITLIVFKVWIFGISNIQLKIHAYIYPYLLGNDIVLIVLSVVTSLYSLWMLRLFKKQHPYYVNRSLHLALYFAFEMFFIMFTILSYVVSAMLKSNFMI